MANGKVASHDSFGGLFWLAGTLALAILSFAAPTHADYTTLASNSGHAVIAPSYVARAQGFTTGSNIDGYVLDGVELFLGLVPSNELSYQLVTLHADDAGVPGDLVVRLANPENLAVGWNTFHAPDDTLLEADTTYYLAVNLEADTGIVFGLGVTAGIGEPSASDWSVQDMSWTFRDNSRWGIDVTSVLQFSLAGASHTLGPTPSIHSVNDAVTSSTAAVPVAYVGQAESIVPGAVRVPETVFGAKQPLLLVSNEGQPQSAWSKSTMGQGFTTGSSAQGYLLGSIELHMESPPAVGLAMPLVTLHADEGGSPGELLARLRNPDNFTAGANRFWPPFAVGLDANTTYHVVVNLAADEPRAFSLVTSGKADVPTGDLDWNVQTGSWLLSSNWLWRPSENHGLRFALYAPGANDPALSSNTPKEVAGTPTSEPSGAPEVIAGTLAREPSSASEEIVATPPPPPPPSTTSGETVATTPSASPPSPSPATSDDDDDAPLPPATSDDDDDAPPPPATSDDDDDAPPPPATSDDDDDAPPPIPPRRSAGPWPWIAGAVIGGIVLKDLSDDPDSPPIEPPLPPPPPPSTDAALSDLEVIDPEGMEVALAPMFSSTTTGYTASVSDAVAWVTIRYTTSDDNARVQYLDVNDMALGDADSVRDGFQANLVVGANTVKVKVTAQDDTTVETYTLAINRASPPSTDAALSDLEVIDPEGMEVALTPMFSSTTTGYTASVSDAVAWVTIGYTTSDDNARVQYLDVNDMALGDADSVRDGFQANLVVGANTVKVKVTAEDGATVETYTLAISRASPPSADAALSDLEVFDPEGMEVALAPMFSSTTTGYTASVSDAVAWVTIGYTTSDDNARVQYLDVNDMALGDADSVRDGFQANLVVGANTVKVKVTAEDGATVETYTLAISRASPPSADAALSDLEVFDPEGMEVALAPMFSSTTTGYTASVSDAVAWVTIGYTTSDANARVQYLDVNDMALGDADSVRDGFQANLVVGANTVKVKVTAEDGATVETYTLAISRASPPSADAALSDLEVFDPEGMEVALAPMFSSTTTGYTASVSDAVAWVTIGYTTSDANARVQYLDANDMALGDADSGRDGFQANLVVGANTVKVKVTAEDGSVMETYTLTLRRLLSPPDQVIDVSVIAGEYLLYVLWHIVIDSDGYRVQWKSGKQDFERGGDREGIVSDSRTALYTIRGLEAGTEYTVRVIAIRTGAEDGMPSKEAKGTPYARRVRSDTTNTDTDGGGNTNTGGALTDLEVTDPDDAEVTLSPTFSTNRGSYTASVANTVTWVTFKPTLRDSNATLVYEDGSNQPLTDADGNRGDFQVNLAEGANTVKLRVTPSGETTAETYTVVITRAAANIVQDNNAPTFSSGTATREFAEDVGDGTRTGVDVGAPVTADDTDNDTLSYTLEGTDEALFAIVSTSGQIRTRSGINYDRESDSSYSVTVKADDGRGGNDTIAVTINLTNAEEKPLTPDAPTVSAVSGSTTSVSVTWTPPTNTGRPSIASYDLQYKKSTESNQDWQNGPQNQTGTSATISSLDEDTNYDVQVRATNSDGDGPYSGTGTGKTARPGNRAPDFGASSATWEFEENFAEETSGGVDVGAPVTATDDDNDSITYSLEGTDAASFDINSNSGQISTLSGTNYDRESDSSYSVTVKADDGEGGTDTIAVTINVTDVEEKPLAPDAPTVSSVQGSTNSLSVEWTAPTNTGRPSIASYDLQYKKTTDSDQDWQDGPQNRTRTSTTISSLDGNISYDVQVRATNADGDGPWSGTGSGTTNADPPQIGSAAIRSFDEDVGDGTRSGVDVGSPVRASDHGASHTYTLGGTDSGSFTVGSSTGQIRSRSGVNYDFEAQSSYSVSVESDDGNGGTESIPVIINLNDVTEKPKKPNAPTVQNIAGYSRVIYVTWTAPSNTGRPPITSYDLQYREGNSGPWFNGPQDQTGMNASITGLSPSTSYQVQVMATNKDGDGPWSDEGSASTSAALVATCAMSENGNVRLADGFTSKEGRLEVCALDPKGTTDTNDDEQVWGTVCDDYWTDRDADVVCKALGYHNSEPIVGRFLRAYFGSGEPLKILLDDLLCDGNETGLLDCPVAGNRPGTAADYIGIHNCEVSETVGVRCLTESEYTQHVTEIQPDDNNQSPMLSVADVTVYETPGTTMDFVVTLSGTPTGTVTVNYATHEGSAHANIDYVPKSGMLTFPLGVTSRTVGIMMLDDLVDEHVSQGERLTLRLSNAIGADILDGVAYGNIKNSDPLPQAWLARFGRAAADQAVEAIGGRLTAYGPRASQVTVAGRRLNVSGNMSPAEAGAATLAARDGGIPVWNAHGASGVGAPQPGALGIHGITGSSVPGVIGPSRGYNSGGYRSSGVSGHQLLTGTSFQWALGEDGEADESLDGEATGSADRERLANWTAWGEGAATRFSGAEDTLSLQGDVATATLGVDREGERWMTGVAVAFSEGEGAFTATGDDMAGTNTGTAGGLLATTLTTVYPYARYAINDRLSLWGVLGYGQGELRLTEGRAGTVYDTDTGLRVGALGARGVVLDARGFELALRSDAMRVQMTSDTVIGLAGASAEVGRLRALLEGSRMFMLGENRSFEPTLEFGLRHDSGDAETGTGIELGAGIRYTDAVLGLSLEANARGLVAHQDSAYEEWGAWATIRMDPGEPGKGLSLSLSPTWGVASSGLDQLWNAGSSSMPGYGVSTPGYGIGSPGYAANSWLNPGGRISAELGYGVDAFHGMGMGTYYSGLERAGSGFQSLRLGKRWELGTQLQMSVEGERNEFGLMDPDHAISVQGLLLW